MFVAGTLYGPVHTEAAIDGYLQAVEEAKQQGGKIEYGGKVSVRYILVW